jgi:acid phosphatase
MVEPDGNTSTSNQKQWLEAAVEASDAHWKIAIFHHPAYTSGVSYAPGKTALRWDWRNLGIDLVLSGHSHNYERLIIDGMTYVVAGIGAKSLVAFAATPLTGSQVRDYTHYGAVKIIDNGDELDVEAWSTDSVLLDNFQLSKAPSDKTPDLVE